MRTNNKKTEPMLESTSHRGWFSMFLRIMCVSLSVNAALSAQTSPAPQQNLNEKQAVLWEKLAARINEIDRALDGVAGVAILDLASGHTFLLHADDVFPQASSIKITVLAELYRQTENAGPRDAKLTDLYIVQSSDLVPDSDIMGGLTPGVTRVTNRDLATMMVAVSDNSATNVLIGRVGMKNVNDLMASLGLTHTLLRRKMMDIQAASEGRENVSTPREMMTLLADIYDGKVLNKEMTEDFFKMLATHKESFIPRLLPDSVRIANKPGELEAVRNDSGIVFVPKRPYVICVMTTYLRNERDGEDAISRISEAAYQVFDRLGRGSDYGRVVSVNDRRP
jgi:beta-lactamase class A